MSWPAVADSRPCLQQIWSSGEIVGWSRSPLIFAIGPLTGYFPLMSKTVCAFEVRLFTTSMRRATPVDRSALALRFARP